MTDATTMEGSGHDEPAGTLSSERELMTLVPQLVTTFRAGWQLLPPGVQSMLDQAGGLGPRHVRVLMQLALHGPQNVSELSALLGLAVPTTSLMVGELSNAGLVTRTEDPADRRRTIVSIAQDLLPEVNLLIETRIAAASAVLSGLEPEERRGFIKGLRLLIAQVEKMSS